MAFTTGRRIPPQLNDSSLQELALRYVGKYATTRAKLRTYLSRKVRERGWQGSSGPDVDALAERFAELGYIDDAAYALIKSRSLAGRGYGKRRLSDKLRLDGVSDSDGAAAHDHADREAVAVALRFAERRKIGPFASTAADPALRQKWVGALVRAGHPFGMAQAIARMPPGTDVDLDELNELFGGSDRNLD
ncbi:MAG TPA: regulatory protein RecX [Sphingomicrobium sp.]